MEATTVRIYRDDAVWLGERAAALAAENPGGVRPSFAEVLHQLIEKERDND